MFFKKSKVCQNCGKKYGKRNKYCPSCGAPDEVKTYIQETFELIYGPPVMFTNDNECSSSEILESKEESNEEELERLKKWLSSD